MLDVDRLQAFREHVREVNNRAIFEIPEILERLLEVSRSRITQGASPPASSREREFFLQPS